jgi:hypothetical protein
MKVHAILEHGPKFFYFYALRWKWRSLWFHNASWSHPRTTI